MTIGGGDAAPREGRLVPRWLCAAIGAALIGAFLLQCLLSVRIMSLTYDEPTYITAGYAYWATHDGRFNIEHPPLLKLLIALPLLPLHLAVPTVSPDTGTWGDRDEHDFIAQFLRRNLDIVDEMTTRARLPVVGLGVLLAVFVQQWAAELWGAEAGLIALLMFVFEPNILAHSSLATLDLGITAFMFLTVYYVWKWLRTGRTAYGLIASVASGLSLLSKYTTLAFLPIIFAEFVFDRVAAPRRGAPRHIAPIMGFVRLFAGGVLVVVALYAVSFHWHPLLKTAGDHRTLTNVLARIPGLPAGAPAHIVALGQRLPVPAVDDFVRGVRYQRDHLREGHPSFFIGHHSLHGWWYYYPVAFLIKTPLPILLLVVFRLFRLNAVPMVAGEYVVVLPMVGMLLLACFDTVDLGLRYILPLYPFLFVWLSRIVALEVEGWMRVPSRAFSETARP